MAPRRLASRCAEDDKKFGESASTGFIYHLGQLPIELDTAVPSGLQRAVAAISREFKLTGYEAQYLELARRRNMPVATLDKGLRIVFGINDKRRR